MSNKHMASTESSRREIEPALAERTSASDRDGQTGTRGSKSLRSKTGLSSKLAPESQNEDAPREASSTGEEPAAAFDNRSGSAQLAELSTLGLPELRVEWRRLFRRDAPRLSRDQMTRMIAYRIQENVFGGLPQAVERRLAKLAGEFESEGHITAPAPPKVRSGARLVREWHGRTHAVNVVQAKLQANGVERTDSRKADLPAILTGLLYDRRAHDANACRQERRSLPILCLAPSGDGSEARWSRAGLPAPAVESLVVDRLRALLADPVALDEPLPELARDAPANKRAIAAAAQLIRLLDEEVNPLREALLRAVLRWVQVHGESVEVELCRQSIKRLLSSDLPAEEGVASLRAAPLPIEQGADGDANCGESDHTDLSPIRLVISTQMRRRGNEMKFLVEGENVGETRRADEPLVRLIVRARILARRIRDNPAATLEEIAGQEGFGSTCAGRLLRLISLAPDIVTAILDGRQPPELTANVLMADTRLPLDWLAQRAVLGFSPRAVAA